MEQQSAGDQTASGRTAVVRILALGLGQMIAFASSFYFFGLLADPISRELGLPPSFLFALMSASLLISAFVAAPTGRWLDRHGGRGLLLASSVVFAAGLAALASAHGPILLAAGALTIGAGMCVGLYETPFAILVALHGDEARRPITGVALIGGLGSTIGWPATHLLIAHFGWRGACLTWAAAHLFICLPLHLVVVPKVGGRLSAHAAATRPPLAHFWDRRMIQLAALVAGAWFVSACMSAHLPRVLMKLGMTPSAAVAAASLTGLAAMTARLLEFTVLRRLPPLATTRAACLLHPAGAAAALLAQSVAGPVLALAQGAGNGMLTVAKGILPLRLYGPEHYGYRSGLLSTPARFIQAAGPFLYGLLLDRSAQLALMVSGGICLFMFAMTLGLSGERHAPAGRPQEV